MVTVETPRLVLLSPEEADTAPLMAIHQDPDVVKYVLIGHPAAGITAAWCRVAMMIGHWHMRGYGQWTVVEKADRQVVGRVGALEP